MIDSVVVRTPGRWTDLARTGRRRSCRPGCGA